MARQRLLCAPAHREIAFELRIAYSKGAGLAAQAHRLDFEGRGPRIDGRVDGNISTQNGDAGTVVISEQAHIDGEINVSHVVVNGTVRGPIIAEDYLELQAKAHVVGDVTYRKLEMQLGAVVQGRLCHNEPGVADVVELKRASADAVAMGATR